jgi:cytochrome c oxidase subunit 2
MTGITNEEAARFEADPYERKWMVVSLGLLIAFMVTVTVAGFALGFQVPGNESRVDPKTVADSPPWSEPGLRDLGNDEYAAYIIARQYVFQPRTITVPVGSSVTFYLTSIDVQHGFMLQDTHVNMQVVPGEVSKLTFEFEEPGEFDYICNEFCGANHAEMFGSVIVEAAAGGA